MCIYLFSDMDLQDCIGASVEQDTEVGNRPIVSIGPLRFIHGTEFDSRSSERLNRILSTDISWNKYEIGGCIGPMNVIVVLMEFIRRHMESGKHMVLYSRCGMVYLDPDMPVSNIDVSSKMPARSLLDGFEFDDDLIYHFYSSKKAEPKTAILDMMSCDGPFFCWHPGRRYWGSCPEEPISLGDLISKVKEEVAFVSVHAMDQTVKLARQASTCPLDGLVAYDPLEVIGLNADFFLQLPRYESREIRLALPSESRYIDCRVLAYMLYSKDEGWSMRNICLGEDDLVGCGIRLAVIIDPLSSLRP